MLVNPLPALIAALIWAFSPIYYAVYLKKFEMLTLNFIRTSLGAGVLLLPALYFGFQQSAVFAVLSGVITLAVGDSLFLISIRQVGASVATPVVYTYVLLIQLTAFSVGESVVVTNIVSATLIILGVLLLSRFEGILNSSRRFLWPPRPLLQHRPASLRICADTRSSRRRH